MIRGQNPLQRRSCYIRIVLNRGKWCITICKRWNKPIHYRPRHHDNSWYLMRESLCLFRRTNIKKKNKNVSIASSLKISSKLGSSPALFEHSMYTPSIPGRVFRSVNSFPSCTRYRSSKEHTNVWILSHRSGRTVDYLSRCPATFITFALEKHLNCLLILFLMLLDFLLYVSLCSLQCSKRRGISNREQAKPTMIFNDIIEKKEL